MKRLLAIITLCLLAIGIVVPVTAMAAENQYYMGDYADAISDEDEAYLESILQAASDKYDTDIIAALVDGTEGEDITSYADYYILNNGYGRGSDADAILLMIDVTGREYHFSTHGETIYCFTDAGIEEMGEDIIPAMKNSDWTGAIETYCSKASWIINYKAEHGKAYLQTTKSVVFPIIAAIVIGLIVAFAITGGMLKQLKSVTAKATAGDYFDSADLKLNGQRETFLYMHVAKVPINTEKKGGGGGFSTHSTGGSTFGGGGGKF